MNVTAIGLLLAIMGTAPAEPPRGIRLDLGEFRVFVPESYRPEGATLNLVIHLHGADRIVENALVETGWPAALVVVNRNGLSSVYAKAFSDHGLFDRLISTTCQSVSKALSREEPLRPGRIVVSSFSAGFGGVRALLSDESSFQRIDGLVLADSLYCGYAEPAVERRLDPMLMIGFRRFARKAAAGRKVMLVSHSAQVPGGYASTTETADELLHEVHAARAVRRRDWGEGWVETRRLESGGLVVIGFEGKEAEDHLRHLRRIAELWKAMPNPFAS